MEANHDGLSPSPSGKGKKETCKINKIEFEEEKMPTYVDPQACNACVGVDQGPLCVYICPNDLMVLRPDITKGFN
jgi:ferredoxin